MTANESKVYQFISDYIQDEGFSPTYEEIQTHFGFASIASVQSYIKQLSQKGHIKKSPHLKRSLEVVKNDEHFKKSVSLPLLGSVAAGLPLEQKDFNEFLDVPLHLAPNPDQSFVVRVFGDSMIEAGIFNKDLLLVEACSYLNNGDLGVVSTQDDEATVKYFYKRAQEIELRPANSEMKPQFYKLYEVTVQGKVIGLIRNY